MQTIRARAVATRERNRADLQPPLKVAALHENKGQPSEARALYNDVLSAEPDWPDALHVYLWFLINQGDAARIHTTLADALREYYEARRLVLRLTASDPGNAQWQRDLFYSFYQISKLQAQLKVWPDAIISAEACFKISERLSQLDPTNVTWQNDVKVSRAWLDELQQKQAHTTH